MDIKKNLQVFKNIKKTLIGYKAIHVNRDFNGAYDNYSIYDASVFASYIVIYVGNQLPKD